MDERRKRNKLQEGGINLNSKENKELYFERKMDTTLTKWKKDPNRHPLHDR